MSQCGLQLKGSTQHTQYVGRNTLPEFDPLAAHSSQVVSCTVETVVCVCACVCVCVSVCVCVCVCVRVWCVCVHTMSSSVTVLRRTDSFVDST